MIICKLAYANDSPFMFSPLIRLWNDFSAGVEATNSVTIRAMFLDISVDAPARAT